MNGQQIDTQGLLQDRLMGYGKSLWNRMQWFLLVCRAGVACELGCLVVPETDAQMAAFGGM